MAGADQTAQIFTAGAGEAIFTGYRQRFYHAGALLDHEIFDLLVAMKNKITS